MQQTIALNIVTEDDNSSSNACSTFCSAQLFIRWMRTHSCVYASIIIIYGACANGEAQVYSVDIHKLVACCSDILYSM
jgi:hypothetical protein